MTGARLNSFSLYGPRLISSSAAEKDYLRMKSHQGQSPTGKCQSLPSSPRGRQGVSLRPEAMAGGGTISVEGGREGNTATTKSGQGSTLFTLVVVFPLTRAQVGIFYTPRNQIFTLCTTRHVRNCRPSTTPETFRLPLQSRKKAQRVTNLHV